MAVIAAWVAGMAVGAAVVWLWLQRRASDQEAELRQLEANRALLEERLRDRELALESSRSELSAVRNESQAHAVARASAEAQLRAERMAAADKVKVLEEAQARLSETFRALSAEALKSNNQSFLDLARTSLERFQEGAKGDLEQRQQAIVQLVAPVKQSLEKVDEKLAEIEKVRTGAYESLHAQVRSMVETQTQLRSETSNLVKALRSPVVRGHWGEMQLRRVVEMAGMVEHCDFHSQKTTTTEDGRFRPDLIVRLPGGKQIVVDAKTPLSSYLEAVEATDDGVRKSFLQDHARQVRVHIQALANKKYWEQFEAAPEFVVLFLPSENIFSAALEQDPSLIEAGVEQQVILATPTTLIALLKAVAYGWKQEHLAVNAREISELGRDLYKRLSDMGGFLNKLGKSLGASVESYNRAVGNLESRVMVSARRFRDLKAAPIDRELEELSPIEESPRMLQAPELTTPAGASASSSTTLNTTLPLPLLRPRDREGQ
jgi:DNA recombination protein RmuC